MEFAIDKPAPSLDKTESLKEVLENEKRRHLRKGFVCFGFLPLAALWALWFLHSKGIINSNELVILIAIVFTDAVIILLSCHSFQVFSDAVTCLFVCAVADFFACAAVGYVSQWHFMWRDLRYCWYYNQSIYNKKRKTQHPHCIPLTGRKI